MLSIVDVKVFKSVDCHQWLVVELRVFGGFAKHFKSFSFHVRKKKVDVGAPVCEMWDSVLVGCFGVTPWTFTEG